MLQWGGKLVKELFRPDEWTEEAASERPIKCSCLVFTSPFIVIIIIIMIMMIMMMMVMMMMMLMKTIFNILDATADVISQLQPGIFPLHTFYPFSY